MIKMGKRLKLQINKKEIKGTKIINKIKKIIKREQEQIKNRKKTSKVKEKTEKKHPK